MADHTPGPWRIDDPKHIQDGLYVTDISTVDDYGHRMIAQLTNDHSDWQANARLIAAAPELLEVAYAITRDDLDAVEMAQAAIAKAEGLA